MLYYNVIVLFHYLNIVTKQNNFVLFFIFRNYSQFAFNICPFAPPGGSFVNDFNTQLTCS